MVQETQQSNSLPILTISGWVCVFIGAVLCGLHVAGVKQQAPEGIVIFGNWGFVFIAGIFQICAGCIVSAIRSQKA